nr:iron ABC transporter permease [Maliibacterium massiliense]
MRRSQKSSTPIASHDVHKRRCALLFAGAAALVLLLCVLSLCIGAVALSPGQVLRALFAPDAMDKSYQIVAFVRLPRMLAALLAGSALAVSGALLQGVLGNALASPGTIGVNAGAGLAAMLLAVLLPASIALAPAAAFTGALAASLLVYLIAARAGASRMGLVLAGVAVSTFLGSLTDTVLTLFPDTQMHRIAFMIGGFSGVSMSAITFALPYILCGLAAALLCSHDLNVLALGEETASSLGMRAGRMRMLLIICSALLAGAAVSFSGLLGFVGLIVPHAARALVGYDHKKLLPMCILLGGGFTLACDLLARILFAPFELPVGIVLSFLGGPFFIYLLINRKRGRIYD